MNILKKIYYWSKRYISLTGIGIIALIVYVIFLQEHSIFLYHKYQSDIDSLENEIATYNDTLQHYSRLNAELRHDPQAVENVGREQFHMTRPGEEVYIFEDPAGEQLSTQPEK